MELTAFERQRLAVYLSGLEGLAAATYPDRDEDNTVICGASESRGHIFARYATRYPWKDFRGARYKYYIRAGQEIFRQVDDRAVFSVFPGDSRSRFEIPTVVKSRLIADRSAPCVLLPLDHERHWGEIAEAARHDVDFAEKDDRLVWRGGTTGVFKRWSEDIPHSARFYVARLELDPGRFDVGYSEVVQIDQHGSDVPLDLVRAKLRSPLTVAQQLRSKFLLSLEGNDVASGLKWMLYSNSTVVMPRPTCETWACEGELVPFEHYVPVGDDLSDLEEVHDWCMSHLGDCARIAQNGRRFIERFLDPARERALCDLVVREYLAKAKFDLRFGGMERMQQGIRRLLGSLVR